MRTISCKEARDTLAEVMNQVAYGKEHYALTRRGNKIAVIISYKEWEAIERVLEALEDQEDLEDAKKALKRIEKDGGIKWEDVKKELGI